MYLTCHIHDISYLINVSNIYNIFFNFLGSLNTVYNFPVTNSLSPEEIVSLVEEIYHNQNNAFRLQFSFGFIMYNAIQNRYRYFIPEDNSGFFQSPFRFSVANDIMRFYNEISSIDVFESLCKQKPSSAWKPILLTNIRFSVFKTNFPLGAQVQIPDFLKSKKCIVTQHLSKYCSSSLNLCLFMALAYTREKTLRLMSNALELFNKWIEFAVSNKIMKESVTADSYPGFDIKQIPYFEECFKVNVHIYEIDEHDAIHTIFKSISTHDETLYLNYYNGHLFPITNIQTYFSSSKFECRNCHKLFNRLFSMGRHERNCSLQTKYTLPGGYVSQPSTVFSSLEEYGIYVEEKDRFGEYIAVYDIECALERIDESGGNNIKFYQRHNPISVAICSNVDGYEEPEVIIDADPDQLVNKLVSKLNAISKKASQLSLQKLSWVKEKLEYLLETYKPKERMKRKLTHTTSESTSYDDDNSFVSNVPAEPPSKRFRLHLQKENVFQSFIENLTINNEFNVQYNNWNEVDMELSEGEEEEEEGGEEEEEEEEELEKKDEKMSYDEFATNLMHSNLKVIYGNFMKFVTQLPVLNFNGSGYDNKVIRSKLIKEMNLHDPKSGGFVIKQANKYTCLNNHDLKLIDISRYLAAGTSYSNFLKSYQIDESKSFLPYSHITSIDVLEETELPSLESGAWYSEIKGKNVLEEDGVSAEENFENLKQIWKDNNMTCLRDLLIHYSKLDVRPLVKACIKLRDFYRQYNICAFTSSISLPGLAQQMLYKDAFESGASFPLPGKYDGEFFNKIKRSLSGGPSIIFNRSVKINETKIGNDYVKQILGWDANSLYLSEIWKQQPQGMFIKYQKLDDQDKFIPQKRDKFLLEKIWLEYLEKEEKMKLIHKFNSNKQTRLGPYLVDATVINPPDGKPTYIDVDGCYFHAHCISDPTCPLVNLDNKDEKFKKDMKMKFDRSKKRAEYIKSLGVNHIIYTECYIRNQLKFNSKFADFYNSYMPKFFSKTKGKSVTEKQIIDGIKSGDFYGFAEVTMSTPDHFSDSSPFKHINESPDEFFGKFPPFFLNTTITKDMYSDVMKEHCQQNNIPMHDKKMLVSALKVEDGFFSTDLIKWYLEHDFKISKLTYAVSFIPKPAFRNFANKVTKARRLGDVRPECFVQGLAMKTLGVSKFFY